MKARLESLCTKIVEWIGSITSLIVHTAVFAIIFTLPLFGFSLTDTLLILTTGVSLEAIYLAILVQMTLNRHTESLKQVKDEVEDLQSEVHETMQD